MTDKQELPLASTSPIIEALVTSKLFEAYLANQMSLIGPDVNTVALDHKALLIACSDNPTD